MHPAFAHLLLDAAIRILQLYDVVEQTARNVPGRRICACERSGGSRVPGRAVSSGMAVVRFTHPGPFTAA